MKNKACLLEEISNAFPLGTLESTILKKLEYMIARAMIHDFSFGHQDDIIKEVERFGCGLKERDEHRAICDMNKLLKARDNLKRRRAV